MQPFDIMERARYNLFAPAPGVLQALCLLLWSAVRQGAFFISQATQNRRAVVVLVNCCARSGSAFFNALVSMREEVTAL